MSLAAPAMAAPSSRQPEGCPEDLSAARYRG